MKFSLVVHGAPPASFAAHSALNFAQAAVSAQHTIHRVFFYHGGVRIADGNVVLPPDEISIADRWLEFAARHSIELSLCIAAALRRGVLNADEQQRYQRSAANLLEGFQIVGLGQLIEASLASDRTITFGSSS